MKYIMWSNLIRGKWWEIKIMIMNNEMMVEKNDVICKFIIIFE